MKKLIHWLIDTRNSLRRPIIAATQGPLVNLALIGNCQAVVLSYLLPKLCPRLQICCALDVSNGQTPLDTKAQRALEAADVIIAQSIRNDFPLEWVRRARLEARFGKKLIFFTNHFFDGYYPELCYIHDPKGQRHVLPGPMGDYHYKPIIYAYQQGLSVAEAARLCEDDAFYARYFNDVATRSLAELKRREAEVDIRIHDYIAEHYRHHRLFYAFNHPSTRLLLQSGLAILQHIGVKAKHLPQALRLREYLQNPSKPVAGPVYREQKLSFDNQMLHQGFDMVLKGAAYETGPRPMAYDTLAVAQAFYRVYDLQKERVLNYPIDFAGLMA